MFCDGVITLPWAGSNIRNIYLGFSNFLNLAEQLGQVTVCRVPRSGCGLLLDD